MSKRNQLPEEVRQRALELYTTQGAAAAAAATGVKAGTIRAWASRAGLRGVRTERQAAAHDATVATAAERRSTLAMQLYADAERLLGQLFSEAELVKIVTLAQGGEDGSVAEVVRAKLNEPTPGDKRHLAVACAVLLDKAQLLSGEATARFGTGMDWEKELEAFTLGAATGRHQPAVTEGLAEPVGP